jgi:hypothetical protein
MEDLDVLIRWSPPTDTGGRPIIGYVITRRSEDTAQVSTFEVLSTDTTYLDNGTSPGVTYEYSIFPFNIAGRAEGESRTITVPMMGEDDGEDKDLRPYLWSGGITVLMMMMLTIIMVLKRFKKKQGLIDVDLWEMECSEE